jgi:hypothetical protein
MRCFGTAPRIHGEQKLIKVHIWAVTETTQVTSNEELCWLAIAAARLPKPEANKAVQRRLGQHRSWPASLWRCPPRRAPELLDSHEAT